MSNPEPKTTDTGNGTDKADDDVQSDPAKGSDDRSDWADEGGATPSGPAGDQDQ
ncbi:hypothetical protein [Nocardia sp. XZ_19_385]|uniref:hypothetical protein n=1 Tax=Nocardia sp. XZ_19_385 TaxID=2769488 RepID=UPI00188E8156|nr:hypothetical protein [Nocardia sp. XZ_19_385]